MMTDPGCVFVFVSVTMTDPDCVFVSVMMTDPDCVFVSDDD